MTEIVVLPHAEICPDGKTFDASEGVSVLDNLLEQGIEVEHACEKSCACTTCHVIVREGYDSLSEASEDEEDLLDRALADVRRLRDGDDRTALAKAVEALNEATAGFAASRMDRSVARALAGKRVDALG